MRAEAGSAGGDGMGEEADALPIDDAVDKRRVHEEVGTAMEDCEMLQETL